MTTATSERGGTADAEPPTLRERIVGAATGLTARSGWASVTMSRLAEEVGVSRQTVYNEIGTKPALAEAMILSELAQFLAVVDEAFVVHSRLVPAIEAAATGVLEFAQDNKLLHAVVSATHGADTDLLPLLTTHSESLLETAKVVIQGHVAPFDTGLDDEQLDAAIDMVVRLVLSHVMQPTGRPAETGADIAWIAQRVIGDV